MSITCSWNVFQIIFTGIMENLITNIGNICRVDYFIYFNNSMNKEQSLFYCSNKKNSNSPKKLFSNLISLRTIWKVLLVVPTPFMTMSLFSTICHNNRMLLRSKTKILIFLSFSGNRVLCAGTS